MILGIFSSDKKKITIRIILGIYLLNTILICIPNITHQYLRAKLKIYEINTIKQIDPIDTVFYVKDTSNSFLSNKFLSFYTKQFKDAKIQEISEKEIMEYCGISEIAIEQFTKCPNEGIILVADFWNIFVDYFYLK